MSVPVMMKQACVVKEVVGETIPQHNTGQLFQITQNELEITGTAISVYLSHYNVLFDILSTRKPVYVTVQDGEEQLMYSTSRMEINKLYEVEWNGENFALQKTKNGVEIFKFYPDEK